MKIKIALTLGYWTRVDCVVDALHNDRVNSESDYSDCCPDADALV